MHSLKVLVFALFSLVLMTSCNKDEPGTGTGTTPPVTQNMDVNFPSISINTSGVEIIDDPKVRARIEVMDIDASNLEFTDYEGHIGIELRGSSSQALFAKKSYGIETWDELGNDVDASIFGLPEEEDWILQGPYSDKTLIRNKLIYDIALDAGSYASRSKFTELFINNEYYGLYVFMEKLKRDKNRIDISKLEPTENSGEDLTGGYILKIDKSTGDGISQTDYNSSNSFSSNYDAYGNISSSSNTHFLYEYPKKDEISNQQKEYIQTYFTEFEEALQSDNFRDSLEGYQKYINVESFIDYFILNEFAHNPDAYRLSTFLYKDKNEKLNIGPIWDFNIAFGNSDFCQGGEPDNWVYKYNDYCPGDFWLVHFWWHRFLEDPAFVEKLKERYWALRGDLLSFSSIESRIQDYQDLLINSGALVRNNNRWNTIGQYVWPNRFVGDNYFQEIDYLKNWINERLDWMDINIERL